MQLFYSPDISESSQQFSFSKEESRHIVRALRKSVGDILQITNGRGWLFTGEIIENNLKRCSVNIVSREFVKPRIYSLHLAVAPTKMNDRYEWFLEKATEIGVDIITPIICDHSERKVIKKERFEKIIQSAMKQSLQLHLPKLNNTTRFSDFINQPQEGDLFIAHCEDSDRKSLKSQLKRNKNLVILIGPEGDFSVKEIEIALAKGFIPVTLGETRLRTETAAVAACYSVSCINQLE
jgi:16S rRNA (uracil1498-N3)-methyltransferase